jgi:hypothetical protein
LAPIHKKTANNRLKADWQFASESGDRNDSCEIVRGTVLFKEKQAIAADFSKKRKSCSKSATLI